MACCKIEYKPLQKYYIFIIDQINHVADIRK